MLISSHCTCWPFGWTVPMGAWTETESCGSGTTDEFPALTPSYECEDCVSECCSERGRAVVARASRGRRFIRRGDRPLPARTRGSRLPDAGLGRGRGGHRPGDIPTCLAKKGDVPRSGDVTRLAVWDRDQRAA